MSLFKWVFGFDQADIESNANAVAAIEKIFPGIFSKINELGSENIDLAEQMNKLKEIYGNIDQKFAPLKENILSLMENVSENTNTLQEHAKSIGETSEKLTSLTEKVGNSDQVLLTYSIVASVAVIIVLSFIAYCLYQSTQQEKEKKNELDNTNLVSNESTKNTLQRNVDNTDLLSDSEKEKKNESDNINLVSNESTKNTLQRNVNNTDLLSDSEKEKKNKVDSYWWDHNKFTWLDNTNSTNISFSKQGHIPQTKLLQTKLPDSTYSSIASTHGY